MGLLLQGFLKATLWEGESMNPFITLILYVSLAVAIVAILWVFWDLQEKIK